MSEPADARSFSYTLLQLVPCLQRDERVNVAVVLHSRQFNFLGIRAMLRAALIGAISPDFDLDETRRALDRIVRIVEGDPAGGELARLPAPERFGWLAAPSSTSIQPGRTHTGLTTDPELELERLFHRLVL